MASAIELLLLAQQGASEPTWSGLTLTGSWSAFGVGTVAPQYRLWASQNVAEVIGQISHSSTSGTSTFCSGFGSIHPASQQSAPAVETVLTSLVQLVFTTGGALEFVGMPASSTVVAFHAFFPLDA